MRALILAAAGLLLAAGPAIAQDNPPEGVPAQHTSHDALGPGGDHPARPDAQWSLERRETWLQQQIDRQGSADGRAKLDAIRTEQSRLTAAHGGLTQTDHHYLEGRIDQLAGRLGLGGAQSPWGA